MSISDDQKALMAGMSVAELRAVARYMILEVNRTIDAANLILAEASAREAGDGRAILVTKAE